MGSTARGKGEDQPDKAGGSAEGKSSAKRIGGGAGQESGVISALRHQRRREILRLLHASEAPLSTDEIAVRLRRPPASTVHHMQVLRQLGVVALVAADGAGDPIETFYVSRVKDQPAVTAFLDQLDND